MHKNKLVKILISSITLFVLCMCCNIIPANAIGNHVISNNSFFGVGSELPYKSKSHPVTHKQLNKKLNRTIYLIKHKKNKSLLNNNHFKIQLTLISINNTLKLTLICSLPLILFVIYKFRKKKKRCVNNAIKIFLSEIIKFDKINFSHMPFKVKELDTLKLICYLNKWSKYCYCKVSLKLLYKGLGEKVVKNLSNLSSNRYIDSQNVYKYIKDLSNQLNKYNCKSTKCTYISNVIIRIVDSIKNVNVYNINKDTFIEIKDLEYIKAYRDLFLK